MKAIVFATSLVLSACGTTAPPVSVASPAAAAPGSAAVPSALAGTFGRAAADYEGVLEIGFADGQATVRQDNQPLQVLETNADSIVVAFTCWRESGPLQGEATLTASATGVQFELGKRDSGAAWDCNGDWDLQFGAWTRR